MFPNLKKITDIPGKLQGRKMSRSNLISLLLPTGTTPRILLIKKKKKNLSGYNRERPTQM